MCLVTSSPKADSERSRAYACSSCLSSIIVYLPTSTRRIQNRTRNLKRNAEKRKSSGLRLTSARQGKRKNLIYSCVSRVLAVNPAPSGSQRRREGAKRSKTGLGGPILEATHCTAGSYPGKADT